MTSQLRHLAGLLSYHLLEHRPLLVGDLMQLRELTAVEHCLATVEVNDLRAQ